MVNNAGGAPDVGWSLRLLYVSGCGLAKSLLGGGPPIPFAADAGRHHFRWSPLAHGEGGVVSGHNRERKPHSSTTAASYCRRDEFHTSTGAGAWGTTLGAGPAGAGGGRTRAASDVPTSSASKNSTS